MNYAGLGAILCRFVGLLMIGSVVFAFVPALASGGTLLSQVAMFGGITLLPAAVLVFASKPLGKLLAAGLE